MRNLLARFVREEEGQDLIEYALLAALIAVVCYVLIAGTGQQVSQIYGKIQTQVSSANAASS